jgi:hypothetical protein
LGLTDIPACGSNPEVLGAHGLDAAGIARAVLRARQPPLIGASSRHA